MPPCALELDLELNSDVEKIKKRFLFLAYFPLAL
jgi:hypothetical protein